MRKKNELNEKTIEQIRMLYETTSKSKAQIKKECNVSYDSINKYIKKYSWIRPQELIDEFYKNSNNKGRQTRLEKYGDGNYANGDKIRKSKTKDNPLQPKNLSKIEWYKIIRPELQKLYETTDMSIKAIADRYNLSKNTVDGWKIKYKWNKPQELKRIRSTKKGSNRIYRIYTLEFINQVKEVYETTSLNNIEIAEKFDLTKDTIWNWSNKYNWEKPEQLKKEIISRRNTKIKEDKNYFKAKELYETTTTPTKEICEIVGWTYNKLNNRIRYRHWVRPKEIEKQVCSNRIKRVQSEYSEEKWKEIKQNMSKSNKEVWDNRPKEETQKMVKHRRLTMSKKSQEELDDMNTKISNSVKLKIDEINKKRIANMHKHIAKDGTNHDSSYEVKVYEYCIDNNLDFEEQVKLHYDNLFYNNNTYIDFKIEGKLYECKGGHLLKGVYRNKEPHKSKSKTLAMDMKLSIYTDNDVTVVTDELGINIIREWNKINKKRQIKYIDINKFHI